MENTLMQTINKNSLVCLEHKTSFKSLGYICRNTLYGSKLSFLFYAKNH